MAEPLIRWALFPHPPNRALAISLAAGFAVLQTREVIGFERRGEEVVIQYSPWVNVVTQGEGGL